jgi:hypothetical protein
MATYMWPFYFELHSKCRDLVNSCPFLAFDSYRIDRGLRTTSRQISFEFLFIKTHPPDILHNEFRREIEW